MGGRGNVTFPATSRRGALPPIGSRNTPFAAATSRIFSGATAVMARRGDSPGACNAGEMRACCIRQSRTGAGLEGRAGETRRSAAMVCGIHPPRRASNPGKSGVVRVCVSASYCAKVERRLLERRFPCISGTARPRPWIRVGNCGPAHGVVVVHFTWCRNRSSSD